MKFNTIMLATFVAAARGFTVGRTLVARPLFRSITTTRLHSTTEENDTKAAASTRLSRQDLSLETRTLTNHLDIVLSHLDSRRASDDTKQAAKQVASLQEERVLLIQQRDAQLNIRKEASAKVGMLMRNKDDVDEAELEAVKAESTQAADLAAEAEAKLETLEAEQNLLLAGIPNLLDDNVPDGADESDNQVVLTWGTPGEYDFECQWHDDVATKLGGYQAEAAVAMSGSRFVALSGDVARLERAIAMFLVDRHFDNGYTELSVPFVVGKSALEGTSQLPKFQDDLFAITPESHTCNGEPAYLIPTAEVPVTNMHRDSVLELSDLPKQYVAWTPCFRAEAGSYGRDTKGLIRTHQFGKVELVKITTAESSDAEHESLTKDAEGCLQALELPYRKVRLCSGDIGFSARHCYDLEVWLPGAAEYREISSCSNTGDFQARRMSLRYRPMAEVPPAGSKKKAKKPKPVLCHTINGSGLAVGRTLVAVLENYQQEDGSVVIPQVLRPYMGGKEKISPP